MEIVKNSALYYAINPEKKSRDKKKTIYNGVAYKHSDYTTATKQKDLPQQVKDAINNVNKKI